MRYCLIGMLLCTILFGCAIDSGYKISTLNQLKWIEKESSEQTNFVIGLVNQIDKDITAFVETESFQEKNNRKPNFLIMDAINTNTLSSKNVEEVSKQKEEINAIKSEFMTYINSSLSNNMVMNIVANHEERGVVRSERNEQLSYSSEETTKRLAQELGADYVILSHYNLIFSSKEIIPLVYNPKYYTPKIGYYLKSMTFSTDVINIEDNVKKSYSYKITLTYPKRL